MLIIGIDPGNEKSALVVLNVDKEKINIDQVLLETNIEVKDFLGYTLKNGIKKGLDHKVVIETLTSYGNKFSQTLIDTAIFIGELKQYCNNLSDKGALLVKRKAIVGYFCKDATKGDTAIRARMLEIYGKEATREIKKDLWSALAIATYFAQNIKLPVSDKI